MFRWIKRLGPGAAAPHVAKFSGAASLAFWIAVIICGRLITFYRPIPCEEDIRPMGFIAHCIIK